MMTIIKETDDNIHVESTSNEFLLTKNNNKNNERSDETKRNTNGLKSDEDEGELCRICRTSAEVESPLYFPCACNGSIKFVHEECLLQWLNHSHAHQCEVCKQAFIFSPIYTNNAPTRLSIQEILFGFATKVTKTVQISFQILLRLSVWFLIVPYITYWTWKFIFVENFEKGQQIFIRRCTPYFILIDCFNGLVLSIGMIFVFLGLTSIRQHFFYTQEFIENDDVAMPHANITLHDINYGLLVIDEPPPNIEIDDFDELANNFAFEGQRNLGEQEIINGENRVEQLAIPHVQVEAHEEQIFDARDDVDNDNDIDFDNIAFDDLMGIQVPLYQLAKNALNVLASNIIFLGLIALIPFLLGCFALSLATKIVTLTIATNDMITFTLTNYYHYIQFRANNTILKLIKFINAKKNLFGFKSILKFENNILYKSIIGHVSNTLTAAKSENTIKTKKILNKIIESIIFVSKFSDTPIIGIGYLVIFVAISFCLILIKIIKYTNREPIDIGHIYDINGVQRIMAALSTRQYIFSNLHYIYTILKISILMIIELGIFPIICGWCLDISTIKIRDITYFKQLQFFWKSPVASTIHHWVAGIAYISHIGSFISILSEVLRPSVLFFLRNPSGSNHNPVVDMINDPLPKHAKRILLSMAMYGNLIATLIYVPAYLATSIAPSMFPLNLRVSDPFTEIPADLVLFHLCVPFAVEHCRPRAIIKRSLMHWFSFAGCALGLSNFLLPEVENGRDRNGSNPLGWGRRQFGGRVTYVEAFPEATEARVNHTCDASISPDFDVSVGGGGNDRNVMVAERRCEKLKFAMRIVLLLTAAWMSLLFVNTTMVLLPITIGRTTFAFVSQFSVARGAIYNVLSAG
ncbi:probable E3 ubiquitin ligase SUD1 isoform X3 [Physcomitrium patens]|uniref:probable E3 ubiquitin ligase SUD1 isoform X3 n=1 Tax=Physcomitrium patens TaxID=3218 RepID=UPI000D173802|nr:probable E3 ubiquitin ligase SUD1 isoform X4 [Physcomitrium patens]|eukprot:XP_024387636.1 probable E3 ubiquitin ligase SUD1 isoform X4 [Physcomitrella patens]